MLQAAEVWLRGRTAKLVRLGVGYSRIHGQEMGVGKAVDAVLDQR